MPGFTWQLTSMQPGLANHVGLAGSKAHDCNAVQGLCAPSNGSNIPASSYTDTEGVVPLSDLLYAGMWLDGPCIVQHSCCMSQLATPCVPLQCAKQSQQTCIV